MSLVARRGVEPRPPRVWTWWLNRLPCQLGGPLTSARMTHRILINQYLFVTHLAVRERSKLRIHLQNCYGLTPLFVRWFSTAFWAVPLMPAICFHTTMETGLLSPSKKYLLYYLLPIYLAGSSWLLHHYRVDSIKYAVLVHYIFLIVLTNWGIRTFVNTSDKRFLLITSVFNADCSSYWATDAYNEFNGASGRTRTYTKLCDSRQTLIVVLTPFESKNATRLRVLSFAFVLARFIHHSRWTGGCFC